MTSHPVDKNDMDPYGDMKVIFQKSVVTAKALPSGTVLKREHLAFKKPGDGIPASEYAAVIGKTLLKNLPENHKLNREDLQ
jgi:N-acetylneuraminate synthase